MIIHRDLDNLPHITNPVLTIGSFDGVHIGHKHIITHLVNVAREVGGQSVVMTFEPHPRQVVSPDDTEFKIITELEEKLALLKELEIDHVLVVPFTVGFSQQDPREYVEYLLMKKLNIHTLIIGYDHRFGLNRQGDLKLLEEYASQGAFKLIEIPQQEIDELKISSTRIRNAIANGNLASARQLSGHEYRICGTVVRGSRIAGGLGFPTANIRVQNRYKILPARGTYVANCRMGEEYYPGMLYVGTSATLKSNEEITVEVHIFQKFEHNFYHDTIEVIPTQFIRPDQRFGSKEELLDNIRADARICAWKHEQAKDHFDVSIAVLNYNGAHHLSQFLPSLRESSLKYNTQLIVIDNASTDNSLEVLKRDFREVRVIELHKNLGFAGGYNEAMTRIGSPIVAIVNSDIEGTPGWIDTLIEKLNGNTNIVAVQPKIRSHADKGLFEYAGAAGGFVDPIGYPYCRGRILSSVEADMGQYDTPIDVDWTSGAAMVIKTETFIKLGGFDESFFAHQEEIDLCWRLRRLGYRLMQIPDSTVYHLGGGTLSYDNPNKMYLNMRNNYWMLRKNLSGLRLVVTLSVRVLCDLAMGLLMLLSGKFSSFKHLARGIKSGLSSHKDIKRKKLAFLHLHKRFKVAPESILKSKSIIWHYIILRKKTFEKIHITAHGSLENKTTAC